MPPQNQPDAGVPAIPRGRGMAPFTIMVLVTGLVLTAFGCVWMNAVANRADEERFARLAERIKGELIRRVQVYRYGLSGTRSFYSHGHRVRRHEFRHMVASRDVLSDFPGALGIGFIRNLENDPRVIEEFVANARADGAPDFVITTPPGSEPMPGAVNNDRMIIEVIEPVERNATAVGLEIGAHPVRREAAQRAMLTGEACITGSIRLVQDDRPVAGFLYMLPVYDTSMPADTLEQRTKAIEGWVYMPMIGPTVFQGVDSVVDDQLHIAVFDSHSPPTESVIFDPLGELDIASGKVDHQEQPASISSVHELQIGGRSWTVVMRTSEGFERSSRAGAWGVGFGGVALTVLLGMLVQTQGSAARRAEIIAQRRTEDLQEMARVAEAATRSKSEFLANMSHELRTPMTAILGYTDLMGQPDLDRAERDSYVSVIRRNGKHLLAVINDILDISRIEAGKLTVESVETDPADLVRQVISMMDGAAEAKGITLECEIADDVPALVESDPIRLRQVLLNLVGNAIKFTEAGHVSIRLDADRDAGCLRFQVLDTGIGMPQHRIERLFEPFEQGDTSTVRKFGGSGLGLSISRQLACLLGGSLTAQSTPGEGSVFDLTVALVMIAERVENEPYTSPSTSLNAEAPAATSARPLDGTRILLAEDGPDNQRLVAFHLGRSGAEVQIAENGRKALEALTVDGTASGALASPAPFDLVLTDIQMPEIDGYALATRLRERGSRVPIVALTANAMIGDREKCLAAGCDGYVAKPINRLELVRACAAAIASTGVTRHPNAA